LSALFKPIPALNVCNADQVFAAERDTLLKPDIAVEAIEPVGNVIVPALTVKPLLNVCNAEKVFVKPVLA